jgi:DNA-binding transcriptional LysR family regulator
VVGLALIAWPSPDSVVGELDPLLALRERAVLVAAPSHPLARLPSVDAARVATEARPLLLLRWWLALPPPLAQLAERAEPMVELPMDTGRYMVLRGIGAGVFPWMQVAEPIAEGRLREIVVEDMPPLVRDSALVRRAGAPPLTPAAEALVAGIRRRAEQLGILAEG